MRSSHLIAIAILAVAAVSPRAAATAAQAWLPEKGEGSIAVLYQDVFVSDHFFDRGQRRDRGEIQTNNLLVDLRTV